jgi:acetyl esterase/lipase
MGVPVVAIGGVEPQGSGETVRDFTPLPAALAPFWTRMSHFFKLWTVKIIVAINLTIFRILWPSPETDPTFTRKYACRPTLPVRIFLPQIDEEKTTIDSNSDKSLLPLYLDIHGGGYAIGDAAIDDVFCSKWCNRTGMIVASLNYRKTPLHPFPVAVHDIAAVAGAVIDDESLPIDKSKVIIGGFSAGGNMCLTSTLHPELQGRIKAAVSYYPVVDWSSPPHVKFATRLYTEKKNETLATIGPSLDWGYVAAGQDRKTKLLSPCYASKEELPPYICIVGAQHDMLCREARDMIYSLAGEKMPEAGWDEGFEKDNYKWMLIKSVRHGFTDDFRKQKGARTEAKRKICDQIYADIHRWLVEKVLV